MNNFFEKIKELNNEVKLILLLFLGAFILWIFNLIASTYFSNILFSILFLFIPLIARYLYEIIKTSQKFQELGIDESETKIYIFHLILSGILSFFVFIVFSRVAYGPANSFGKAMIFGIYGFFLVILLLVTIKFIDKVNLIKDHKYLNIVINGIVLYFLINLLLRSIFDPSLFPGKGFQRLIYLVIESAASGWVYSIIWYFLENPIFINEYLDNLQKYKIKIEKVDNSQKNSD